MATSAPALAAPATALIMGRKLQSLDGLRAIAVMSVVFCHLQGFLPAVNIPMFVLQKYLGQGWMGVDLFFVLSGFLITSLLMDTRLAENYFSGFYGRRILRIFPLYYLVLISVMVISQLLVNIHAQAAPAIASSVPPPQDRWVYLCFLTNWLGLWHVQWDSHFNSILAHFWSLGIEEQFYFVWPLVIWLARPRQIPWIAGIVAVLSALIRGLWAAHIGIQQLVPPQSVMVQLATICRLDGLFIGALAACLFRTPTAMEKISKFLPTVAIVCLGAVFCFFLILLFDSHVVLLLYGPNPIRAYSLNDAVLLFMLFGEYTVLALGFGALVLFAAYTEHQNSWLQKILQSRFLAPIGKYSYGIYVIHVPLLGFVSVFLFSRIQAKSETEYILSSCACFLLVAMASFATAALSYEFFEKKILRLKRYFEPRFAAPVPALVSEELVPAELD